MLKDILIGSAATAALVVSLAKPAGQVMVAGPSEGDAAVTEIARVAPDVGVKSCSLQPVTVRQEDGPKPRWLCDGAYLPNEQAWLGKVAGPNGIEVVLTPYKGAAGVRYDARVTRRK
jgi:hypothetical protein